ncbi:MAG: ABC transporter substrate-binding protein [Deltaproteobacteria bacterium]|nr:ABC transporter substrate-binding protein [Deltaproteobacteria bacterium]
MKFFALIFLLPTLAFASPSTPTAYIQANVDAVITILAETQGDSPAMREAQARRLSTLVDDFFDSEELSRRALGQYWRLFSPEQRVEFEGLFLKLIKQVYLRKSIAYNNEQVTVDQEIMKSDEWAEVFSTIVGANVRTKLIYYLKKRDSAWKVYDVSVENVSFVKNYRSQFQGILQNNPPAHLISILREKTNE